MINLNLKTISEATRFAQRGKAYSTTRVAGILRVKVRRGGDFYSRYAS